MGSAPHGSETQLSCCPQLHNVACRPETGCSVTHTLCAGVLCLVGMASGSDGQFSDQAVPITPGDRSDSGCSQCKVNTGVPR